MMFLLSTIADHAVIMFYFFQPSCSNLSYTLENNMEPNITSYKPSFWGSMLVFEGVSQMIFQSDNWFLGLFDQRISLVRMEHL